jgi:hypothetical protein
VPAQQPQRRRRGPRLQPAPRPPEAGISQDGFSLPAGRFAPLLGLLGSGTPDPRSLLLGVGQQRQDRLQFRLPLGDPIDRYPRPRCRARGTRRTETTKEITQAGHQEPPMIMPQLRELC